MVTRRGRVKARIAVTGASRGSEFAFLFTWLALRLAGARAVLLTPARPRTLDDIDGFVLGGGADVDPSLYSQTLRVQMRSESVRRHPLQSALAALLYLLRRVIGKWRRRGLDAARDAMELRCLDHAVERGLPVLGICRGAQLLNVHLGGSLFQSIDDFYAETPQIRTFLPRKLIELDPHSRLATTMRLRAAHVNSLHRQSVDRLGDGLRVAAREPNGVVQAIESLGPEFRLGVQWHPEYLLQRPEQRALFRALVDAAHMARRTGMASTARAPSSPHWNQTLRP